METGKQSPNRDTYELLMERMGRIRERAYSMLSVSDFKVLEKMKRFEDCIHGYDYEQAEEILQEIKSSLGNTVLDKQFLIRAENLIRYRLNQINTDEFLKGLQQAIQLTIPRYGTISLASWPLTFNEALLLLNISTAYAEKEDYEKAISTLEESKSALKQSYMDEQQRVLMQLSNIYNLSKWLSVIGEYEKSTEVVQEGIELCRKYRYSSALPQLIYCAAYNMEQLINMGVLPQEYMSKCLYEFKKGYFLASAFQSPNIQKVFEKHVMETFQISLSDY
jgi:tetratricopeptide (TPR) repeat protein